MQLAYIQGHHGWHLQWEADKVISFLSFYVCGVTYVPVMDVPASLLKNPIMFSSLYSHLFMIVV